MAVNTATKKLTTMVTIMAEHHGDVEPRPGVGTKSIIKPLEGTPKGLTRRPIRANRLRVSKRHRGTPKHILLGGETPPDGVVPKDAPATVTEGDKTESCSDQCLRGFPLYTGIIFLQGDILRDSNGTLKMPRITVRLRFPDDITCSHLMLGHKITVNAHVVIHEAL
ncbi:LOW QUALITY PROTEIN: hypothetical protein X943_002590 [Babesia divergens]|uniref:Uncharacterized protein n=1 Tax=Babesia divergens TaxID=32595 RepID=A0AAD9G936_BABDI|nr:LOW QUALITY PROTEIN: hypothetical protein X943_002590 [Babesia divergens]